MIIEVQIAKSDILPFATSSLSLSIYYFAEDFKMTVSNYSIRLIVSKMNFLREVKLGSIMSNRLKRSFFKLKQKSMKLIAELTLNGL